MFRSQPDGVLVYQYKASKTGTSPDPNSALPFRVHMVNEAVQKLSGIEIDEVSKLNGGQ